MIPARRSRGRVILVFGYYEVDYEDYRDVAGVKLPFKIVITWTDGQSHLVLNDIQPNATIDPQKFSRPVPPAVK